MDRTGSLKKSWDWERPLGWELETLHSLTYFILFIYLFGCTAKCVGSWFHNQGPNLSPLHWRHGVLTTGQPGKSLHSLLDHFWRFLKKFIYSNCRLITLQYCSGFCHILTWISHGCTCVPHPEPPYPLPPHPSLRVIPVHQPWAPCLMHRTWTGDLFHMW